MATENEITKALTVLAAAYPRFDLPDATIKIYQRLLSDLEFDLLKAATLQCATMCKFFPTVAEIRDAAVEIQTMADGIPSDVEAWGEVMREIPRVHQNGTPVFSHPLIDQIVRDLGWKNLCMSENQTADRARFMDAYAKNFKVTRRKKQMLPEVVNIVDRRIEDRAMQVTPMLNGEITETPRDELNSFVPAPDDVRERLNTLFLRKGTR